MKELLNDIAKELGLESCEIGDYRDLEEWIPCATIKAVNWTPWWGGNYEGIVRDPKTLKPVSKPTSETVKGVLRWVLRAALAAHVQAYHRDLDEILAPIYGGIKDESEEHLDSLVRIIVNTAVDEDMDRKVVQQNRYLERLIRDLAKKKIYDLLGRKEEVQRSFCKILAIPRFELMSMGKDEKYIRSIIPIPPNSLYLEISIDISRRLKRLAKVNAEDVCKLTLLALIYALSVRGIGRGATRGFGRFRIEDIVPGKLCSETVRNELLDLAKHLTRAESVEKAIEELHLKLINSVKSIMDIKIKNQCNSCVPSLNIIPNAKGDKSGTVVEIINNAKIPSPRKPYTKLPISDIYDALVAIGRACMKNTWKAFCSAKGINGNVKAPGIGLHTWILGLPRWQAKTGTGYAFIDPGELAEVVGGDCSKNFCIHVDSIKNLVEEGRRVSTVIMYPLPEPYVSTIVVIVYRTVDDHTEFLSNERRLDNEKKLRLYHIGRHGDVRNTCRHVVDLREASLGRLMEEASSETIVKVEAPKEVCRKCADCDADIPAGIVYPNSVKKGSDPKDIVLKVYEAALEHIRNVLT